MTPTDEQQAIIDAYTAGDDLVIEAGAGAGKTSTLKLLAAATPGRRGVYVAYNRSIADDAAGSFPPTVLCKTAHALAFGAVAKPYIRRLRGPRVPAREAARILQLTRPAALRSGIWLTPEQLARLAVGAVSRFCYSADPDITGRHVPKLAGLDDQATMRELRDLIPPLAKRAWADVTSHDGRLRFEHDHYLKLWQLSQPRLDCDYVLLDEAQDANPCVADVLNHQTHAQRILVGDQSQAIYGWRGAIDAMATFPGVRRTLSQSFRFGPAIAQEANKWLAILGAPLRLRGFDKVASTVGPVTSPDAVLCRTNTEAVAQVMTATDTGRRTALVGDGKDIKALAQAALDLQRGRGTNHPELLAFTTWEQVKDYVEQENEAAGDLKRFVKLIDTHTPQKVIATLNRLEPEPTAEVVISTAHKAKGREWDRVQVAGDFREPKQAQPTSDARDLTGRPDQREPAAEIPRDEAMLAYVTVTRGKQQLDRGGLAWVDAWVPQRPTHQRPEPARDQASAVTDGPDAGQEETRKPRPARTADHGDGKPKHATATRLLGELLQTGPRSADELRAAAANHGLAWRTVQRAAETLGVEVERRPVPGKRGRGRSYWSLPNTRQEAGEPPAGQIRATDHNQRSWRVFEPSERGAYSPPAGNDIPVGPADAYQRHRADRDRELER